MSEFFIGILFSLVFILFVFYLVNKFPIIKYPILVGAVFRLALAWLIGTGAIAIPGTTSDAVVFENMAREWAELSWSQLFSQFDPSQSYVVSFFAAIFYKVIGPSPVMLNIINATVSMALIIASYRLTVLLFGIERAKIAAWIIAVFPFAVLYGSVYRREVFGSLFFMLGLFSIAKWVSTHNPASLLTSLILFLCAAGMHGGFVAGVFGVLLILFSNFFSVIFRPNSEAKSRKFYSAVVGIFLVIPVILVLILSDISINKIGSLTEIDVASAIEYRVQDRMSEGGSSYPDFLRGVDPFSNPFIIPGRLVYFLFSPFPWDIESPEHLLGLFASFLFIYMAISIFRSRRIILENKQALAIFLILLITIFVYAVSIDNIGTAIRHRTKFVYVLVALCGVPVVRKFVISRR